MSAKVRCSECGEVFDCRGASGHARTHPTDVTFQEVETMENAENTDEAEKPVRESNSSEEVLEAVESDEEQLVGVEDDAIVFRDEIIVTDPEIKERIADKLVEQSGMKL